MTGRSGAAILAACLTLACARAGMEGSAGQAVPSDQAALAAAQQLLEHGAAAWNRGDLDGFVSDYAPDATFVTAQGLVHGRQAIRARYAPRFEPGARRDSLWFGTIEARWVDAGTIQMVAWWNLGRGDSVTARGPTSLLLRRVGGRWMIVHDHSA